MQRSLALTLAAFALVLTGCASQPEPYERPYTDAEIKQFALEMLSRSNLSYEDYEKVRSALMKSPHRMSNAIRDVESQDPAGASRG